MESPEMGEYHRNSPALKSFAPVAGDEWKRLGSFTGSAWEHLRGSGSSGWVTQLDERFKAL